MESSVKSRVAVLAATLRGVCDGGLFEDPVATAATLRRLRTEVTRLIVDLEREGVEEARAAAVEVREGCTGA